MNKKQFLDTLYNNLNLPKDEKDEIFYDYKEHFDVGYEKGKTDDEIIKELGDPKKIAKQYLAFETLETAKQEPNVRNVSSAILAALGLGFFNLTFVLAFILAGAFIVFACTIVSGAICFIGAMFILSPIFPVLTSSNDIIISMPYYKMLFLGAILIPFGFLATKGMISLNKKFYRMVLRYIEKNIQVIKNA